MPTGLGGEVMWLCPSLDDSPNDLSGNGNNGTYANGISTVADDTYGGSRAYNFDGADDYISIYDNGIGGGGGAMDFLASADWSASFYAKCDNDAGNARDPFFGTRTRGGYEGWYAVNNDNFNDYGITWFNGSSWTYYGWTNNPQLDTNWHHVSFVNSAGTVSLYVDGVKSAVTNAIPDLTEFTSFYIGRANNWMYFNGRMDDIRLYSRVLTQPEITLLASTRGFTAGGGTHINRTLLGVG